MTERETTFENIVRVILEKFPEYARSKEFKEIFSEEDLGLPYIIFGHFVRYTMELFKKNGPDDSTVQRLFSLVNDRFEKSQDKKLLDLLTIEVFENYAQEAETLAYARKVTNEKARFSLETALWWTGVDTPDPNIAPEAYARRMDIRRQNDEIRKTNPKWQY